MASRVGGDVGSRSSVTLHLALAAMTGEVWPASRTHGILDNWP